MFQTKVSVFEKAVILDHSILLSVEALKLSQGQLHFLKWNHVFYRFQDEFSDLQHKVILVTQSMKIVEKSFLFLFISYDNHNNTHR